MRVAPDWLGAPGVGFNHEAKIVRDNHGIRRIVGHWYGRIKRPVEADGAQEGVLSVGDQPVSGQDTGRGSAVVDQSLPAWKSPRGRPEIQLTREAARQRDDSRRHRGSPDD